MINTEQLTEKTLAGMFDHTNLKAFADRGAMEKLCQEAKTYGFAMVAINSVQVRLCREFLAGTPVHVGAAISFPLGQTTLETKVFETQDALKNGADEIDYVVNLTEVKNGNWDYIRREMEGIVTACRSAGAISKVIFENCYLEKEEIRHLAQIALSVRPDFIKTSTGFGTGGALVEDVRLMKETVGDAVKVKAAGGIRTWESCREMIEAGAERIGTSAGIQILEAFRNSQSQ
ncbi:MAG: deoxyribose-phosphate aldolase [Lachnospiraceae bacterium]|nr:deoxyribose-phosphate aldolase [Lachnospiraceae bacterium]